MQVVRDIMNTSVISVPPNALIEQALELMMQHRISGLTVVDDEGRLVGVITEYDALSLLIESHETYWPVLPIDMFMSTDVETVDEATGLDELIEHFREKKVRRLPVLRDGRLVGMVARREVIRAICNCRKELAKLPM